MTRRGLADLARLAAMQREVSLAEFSRTAAERSRLQAQIAALRADVLSARTAAAETGGAQQYLLAERFSLWATGATAAINLELAAKTVQWMDQRQVAAKAHGRASVLDQLSENQAALRARTRDRRARSEG